VVSFFYQNVRRHRLSQVPALLAGVLFSFAVCLGYSQEPANSLAQHWQLAGIAASLDDPISSVRLLALQHIKRFSNLAGIPASRIAEFLKDQENSEIRRAAVEVLGAMHAKEQSPELAKLLKDRDAEVRLASIQALGAMQATEQSPELVKLLKDDESLVQCAAADRLREMHALPEGSEFSGSESFQLFQYCDAEMARASQLAAFASRADEQAQFAEVRDSMEPAENILELMKAFTHPKNTERLLDPSSSARFEAARIIGAKGPLPANFVVRLSESYYVNPSLQPEIRFLCYYLTGGDASVRLVLRRIMFRRGQPTPMLVSSQEARQILRAFQSLLPARWVDSGFAADADKQIIQIAVDFRDVWSSRDTDLFTTLSQRMGKSDAVALEAMIKTPWWWTALNNVWKIVALQIAFWILLLYFYPRSPQVQAFFFWNRWARKFVGLGYVDLLLTWIPFLRNRLLTPFRDELVAEARIGDDNLKQYFDDVEVQEADTSSPIRIDEAIPEVRGQVVFEGESGIGKSMFLRRLVKQTKFPITYLPAEYCDHGVLEGIQLRLKGKAADESFLKSIIWSGGLRVIIDGLNEVTVETREKIRRFLDDFPKAHVLLATQPLLWKRPPRAKAFRLMKLDDRRILSFLQSRYASFQGSISMSEADYNSKCVDYLEHVFGEADSREDRDSVRLVLSNPMDLTTVAQILASGERPTLTNLQEQQFRKMKCEFEDIHPSQEFPIEQFSENVYQRRLRDETTLDSDQYFEVIHALAAHKMVLEQNDIDASAKPTRKWIFRHDKIRDFFLMRAVVSKHDERISKHVDDPRFRGVYIMLASQLPFEQARSLRDSLVDRAAETNDHYLSDSVVQLLKARGARSQSAVRRLKTDTPLNLLVLPDRDGATKADDLPLSNRTQMKN
jgi:hypothetical protein